jgi:hypothetical protein
MQLVDAMRLLDRAEELRAGADVTRVKAAVLLLRRDFAGALQLYQSAAKP